jgi:hypothetical protein
MARPKNLNTKGEFSVFDEGNGEFTLRYKGLYIILRSKSRCALYTERAKYSSWFEKITNLLEREKKHFYYKNR